MNALAVPTAIENGKNLQLRGPRACYAYAPLMRPQSWLPLVVAVSSITLAACGGSDDDDANANPANQPAPTENRCTMTVKGDEASELGEHTFDIVTPIPPVGDGRLPLVASSHRPAVPNSNVICFQFTADDELSASFSITYPGKLDKVAPVQLNEDDDAYEQVLVTVTLGDREWQCQARNAKDYVPFAPLDPIGTFSASITSAAVGFENSAITWFGVHGRGHAECEGEGDTPGSVTVDIEY